VARRSAPRSAFKKGNPGGPGRPKGSLDKTRMVRAAIEDRIWSDGARVDRIMDTLYEAATTKRTVVSAVDLIARIMKELGLGAASANVPAFVFITNVNPEKLDAMRPRALQAGGPVVIDVPSNGHGNGNGHGH
jgi:hypothetical protein